MTLQILESLISKAAPDTSAVYDDLEEHLIKTFSTFESLNDSFLNGKDPTVQDPGLDLDAVRSFYQRLHELPTAPSLFLSLIKTSEVLLRRPGRPLRRKEDLRFLLIILENPALGINFFNSFHGHILPSQSKLPPPPSKPPSTIPKRVSLDGRRRSNPIEPQSPIGGKTTTTNPSPGNIARPPGQMSAPGSSLSSHAQHTQHSLMKRLYGIISNLPNELHHYLVNWFARLLSPAVFRRRVEMINSFIAYRLDKHQKRAHLSGPSGAAKVQGQLYTNDWQIKGAARMMALFFAANTNHPKIQISEFYNTLVDYCDLIMDFDTWEHKVGKFSFCQYPFLLSMGAKMNIMEYDARRQMEVKAKEAFFTTVFQKRTVPPHLILKVRRDCIIEDSLTQISCNEMDVKKGLRIEFIGEDGVDAGGLRKEWFLLLCREVFDPLYGMILLVKMLITGMFTWDEDSYCWFNPNSFETSDQFFLLGVVLGLAIYNSTILDVHLPLACYKKLLGVHCGLEDLKTFKPAVANSLEKLLAYEGDDFEEVFGLDFVTQKEGYGQMETVDLVPGGSKKPVTKANRHEYVRRYTQYLLDTSISKQFEPFKRGFYHVCGGNALSLFRPEEIELLIRGSPEKLDVDQLRAVAVYEGETSRVQVSENEPVIRWCSIGHQLILTFRFWNFFARMDPWMQRKLLMFVTGSDRIPATGVANLAFKISILGDSETRFPIAHTCFNQLCLYRYRSRARLEKMLARALEESEGFGLK